MSLTFDQLCQAHYDRAPYYCQSGKEPDLAFAALELGGEVGELQNKIKKLIRHQLGMAGGENDPEGIHDELGDVVICCSLLAVKLGVNLGEITARKFNKTSRKHGFPVLLPEPATHETLVDYTYILPHGEPTTPVPAVEISEPEPAPREQTHEEYVESQGGYCRHGNLFYQCRCYED